MEKIKNTFWENVWEYVLMTVGSVVFCIAWTSFLIPNGISSGGLTGLCTILQFGTGIPVSTSFFILNLFLLLLGFLLVGKKFGIKTIYVIILQTFLFDILSSERFDFMVVLMDDRFLTCVVGGILEAIGLGVILSRGGSSGGLDILAMIINKYWPVSPGRVYMVCDLFIIASLLLVPGKGIIDMMYGYLVMFVFSVGVDYVLLGNKQTVQILIMSKEYNEIADYLVKEMKRGVTALNSVGWYSGNEGKVLLVVARKYQVHPIMKAVRAIDHKAFISISSANSVYGEGFEELKTGFRKIKKDEK